MTDSPRVGRRAYLFLALGTIAFTIYGSYVPFHFRSRPWHDAVSTFVWTMQTRTTFESRSDGIANWMLGVPLGFSLLGALRAGRSNGFATALIGGCLVPLCCLFAAAVEFGQLWFPLRTCSGTDVIAQTLGALCGVLSWVLLGPWLTDRINHILLRNGPQRGMQFFLGYAVFLLFVQWLPLDFCVSPHDLYRWMKRDYLKVSYVPFEELRSPAWRNGATVWDKVQGWIELAILFLPLGLLIRNVPWFRRLWRVPLFALAFAWFAEAGQITVSRHPSSTDVIVEWASILFGWGIAAACGTEWVRRRRTDAAMFLLQLWLIAMVLIHWQPFRWASNPWDFRKDHWVWWPLPAQVSDNYLTSLDKVLLKFVLFAPLGILVAWGSGWSTLAHSKRRALIFGGATAFLLEAGQSTVVGNTGSPVDVLFGLIGGWLGAGLALQVVKEGTGHGNR